MTEREQAEAITLGKQNGRLDKLAGRRLEVSYGTGSWDTNSYPYWYGIGYRQGWDSTPGR